VAYLFGGRGSAELNDLWVYDLTADGWTRLAPKGAGPPARTDHVAVWIDGLGLVIAGGRSGTKVLDDLWAYDPNANAWRTLATTGPRPPARGGSCSTLSTDGRLWITGGRAANGTYLGDTWAYDPGPSTWKKQVVLGAGPEARDGAACWWTSDGALALYGGRSATAPALADLWTFDGAATGGAWAAHDGAGLPARARAADGGSQAIVAVGGLGADGKPRADVTIFDPSSLAATTHATTGAGGSAPEARSGASLVDDPESERELVFGGRGSSGPSSEVWALTLP
jgi:galactose oxidase-like protein